MCCANRWSYRVNVFGRRAERLPLLRCLAWVGSLCFWKNTQHVPAEKLYVQRCMCVALRRPKGTRSVSVCSCHLSTVRVPLKCGCLYSVGAPWSCGEGSHGTRSDSLNYFEDTALSQFCSEMVFLTRGGSCRTFNLPHESPPPLPCRVQSTSTRRAYFIVP